MRLNELTIVEALDGLKKKSFTSYELVEACFNQIEKFDSKINSFISTRKKDALSEANKVDDLIKKDNDALTKFPLLGIPYSCKDNYSTIGIETTAASKILKGYIPTYESEVTKKIKEAGAILIGKTNLDAFAHGSSTEESDFMTTKNPWDTSKVPGGSSGGSAASVISNMCIFSIGSETGGSIRCPSAWCGVSGLKSTYGRVSRYGLIAMASSTDSPGPLTKTVKDASIVLEIIAGKDNKDATTSKSPVLKYSTEIEKTDPKKLRIGLPKTYFETIAQVGVKESLDAAVEKIKQMGSEVVEIDMINPKYAIADYTIIQRSEVSSNLARFDGIRFGHKRDQFGKEAKKRIMLGNYVLSAGYYDQYYSKAQKVRTLLIEEFNKIFKEIDLIVAPSMPTVAIPFGENERSPIFGELTDVLLLPVAMAGLPALSIPVMQSENLPVGMQIIGPQFSEEKILGFANAFQNVTEYHKKFPNLEEL